MDSKKRSDDTTGDLFGGGEDTAVAEKEPPSGEERRAAQVGEAGRAAGCGRCRQRQPAAALRADAGRVWRCAAAGPLRLAAVSAVRHRHGQGPRAAARGRRPEAGAGPHPLHDVGQRHARGHQAHQVGGGGRRRAREVPPARRRFGVRRAGAPGAGLHAALSAGGRRGQLRLARRRRGGGVPIHGSAPDQVRRGAAVRARPGHGGLHRQLRRHARGAGRAAGALAGGAAQRRLGHRGGDGHRDPQPQPERGGAGRHRHGARSRAVHRRDHEAHQGPRLPRRCADHHAARGAEGGLHQRPRLGAGARALEHRAAGARPVAAGGPRAAAGHVDEEGARGDRRQHQPAAQGREEIAHARADAREAAGAVDAGQGARRERPAASGAAGVRAARPRASTRRSSSTCCSPRPAWRPTSRSTW